MLGQFDQTRQYVCYCSRESADIVPARANFRKVRIRVPGTSRPARILYENSVLQWRARLDRVDLMHWFGNTIAIACSTPSVVTIHDLIMFTNPDSHPLPRRAYLRLVLPLSVRRATVVAPVSQSTADGLMRRFRVRRERMAVVPNPVDPHFAPAQPDEVQAIRRKYSLPERFWLYVAHCYPHKNHRRLLTAYQRLKTRDPAAWPLVLRGETHGMEEPLLAGLASENAKDAVRWLPRLSRDEMRALYAAAGGLVFPSLAEGCGLPVLEAMACGCPVIASDIPTTREFAGNAAMTFDGTDVNAIAEAMESFARNADLREMYRRRGFAKVAQLRPEIVYARLIQAYRAAARPGLNRGSAPRCT
jgi:alpha-1,3-rhamnosyl/mannosyltransferase